MNKMRWIGAATAVVAIVVALGVGVWFGGGPTSRGGWEAASWAAGITTALALIASVLVWATTSKDSPSASPEIGSNSGVGNSVNGNVSSGTMIQGRDMRVNNSTHGGDHVDFRNGTFHGPVIGKQVRHPQVAPKGDKDLEAEK